MGTSPRCQEGTLARQRSRRMARADLSQARFPGTGAIGYVARGRVDAVVSGVGLGRHFRRGLRRRFDDSGAGLACGSELGLRGLGALIAKAILSGCPL
jgi:hypothetical protein